MGVFFSLVYSVNMVYCTVLLWFFFSVEPRFGLLAYG